MFSRRLNDLRRADSVDTELARRLPFAFDDRLGFLTACPSNVGTGMRASVMLHLPGLALTGQVEALMRGAQALGFAVREPDNRARVGRGLEDRRARAGRHGYA